MDKQLAQLDTQLLSLSDYLDGNRSTMFPPHLIMYVEDTVDSTMPLAADGRRLRGTGNAAMGQQFSDVFKKKIEPPTPAMVEDDLNSGKW